MTAWRAALVGVGTVGIVVGALLLLDLGPATWLAVAPWALGPIAVHDLLLAPAAVAGAWVARRLLPRPVWGPVAVGVVVTAGLVLVSLVVLGRPGAIGDNPSLLDRDYTTGLLAALVIVWLLVGAACAVAVRRGGQGVGPGRR